VSEVNLEISSAWFVDGSGYRNLNIVEFGLRDSFSNLHLGLIELQFYLELARCRGT
jgi:hypothetical protein